MPLLLAIITSLAWGLQGYLLKFATTKTNTLSTMTVSYLVGVMVLLPIIWQKIPELKTIDTGFLVLALVVITTNILAGFSYYKATQIGNVAIVVPIVSCSGAATLVLSLFSGETISSAQIFVVMGIMLGIILASRKPLTHQTKQTGALYAIIAMLCYGISLWVIGSQLRRYLDGTILSWFLMLIQLILVGGFQLYKGISIPRAAWGIVTLTGLLGVTGYVTLTMALGNQQNGLVAVIGSIYGLISAVLASIFLRERLIPLQWLGVGLALLGVVLIVLVK
jgi:drug/metabolite transporter (DMT)-like permease